MDIQWFVCTPEQNVNPRSPLTFSPLPLSTASPPVRASLTLTCTGYSQHKPSPSCPRTALCRTSARSALSLSAAPAARSLLGLSVRSSDLACGTSSAPRRRGREKETEVDRERDRERQRDRDREIVLIHAVGLCCCSESRRAPRFEKTSPAEVAQPLLSAERSL